MSETAYGIHAVDVILRRSPERIIALSIQSDRNDKRIQGLLSLAQNQGVAVDRVSKADLDEMVSERHQGVVAVIRPRQADGGVAERDLSAYIKGIDCPLVLVLDGVTDPHNLGALLRSAMFLGVSGIVVSEKNSSPLSPAVSKASAGAMELMQVHSTRNMVKFLESAREGGWQVVGAALEELGALASLCSGVMDCVTRQLSDGLQSAELERQRLAKQAHQANFQGYLDVHDPKRLVKSLLAF